MTNGTPALPQGFTLDEATPSLPPGFTIDTSEAAQASLGQEQPGILSRISQATEPSPAFKQGMTYGLSDEVAGAAAAVGPETLKTLTQTGDIGQTWETMKQEYGRGQGDVQAELDAYMEENPVWGPVQEIIGAMVTANIPKATALTFGLGAKYAKPILQGMGLGGLYGFGIAEQDEKAKGVLVGAAAGGAVVGVGQALSPFASKTASKLLTKLKKKPKAPQLDALREQASVLYEKAHTAGVVIPQRAMKGIVDSLRGELAEAGIDQTIHPKALAAFKRLEVDSTKDVTLKGFDILRRVAKGAAGSNEKDERRIARIIIDKLDDFTDTLGKEGGMLKQARSLWHRMSKGEVAEDMITKAANEGSRSARDNVLRNEFKRLANNPKRLRGFSKEEQATIRRVANGGPVEKGLRLMGQFAPRGVISTVLGIGVGNAAGGPVGAGALLLMGEATRRGASALTRRNARIASDLMRKGGAAPTGRSLVPQGAREATSSLLPRLSPGVAGQTPAPPSAGGLIE